MYPNNFFMPINTMRMVPNGLNILPQKTGGLFSSLKAINWGNLLNNANRTLNVVNQTIPLVKQAGPMFNNMKSMIKLASAFKDETDNKNEKKNITKNHNEVEKKSTVNYIIDNNNNINNINNSNNMPNFFI